MAPRKLEHDIVYALLYKTNDVRIQKSSMEMIKNMLKKVLLKSLPDPVIQLIKKLYYPLVLKSLQERDERDFTVVKYLVEPGNVVLDIGANIGVYTKYLSDLVGDSGKVYSIEPVPSTFEILSSNVKRLGLKNVNLINCAVSETNGTVTMQIPLYDSGWENYHQAAIVDTKSLGTLRMVEVKSKTIDSLMADLLCNISFIKCDVEGHELPCIKGAINVLKNHKPAWLIEISGNPDEPYSSSHELFHLLAEQGYEAWWFDGTRLNKRQVGDRSVNFFFLNQKQLQKLLTKNLLVT